MTLTPTTYDRLHALWERFDSFPEAQFVKDGGAVLKRDAYLAFLDARLLIESLSHDLYHETKGWRPIAEYFDSEPETARVLLWAVIPETGEYDVTLGYYDADEQAWYREREGPDLESVPLQPEKFMALRDLMRSADEREFVSVPRMG